MATRHALPELSVDERLEAVLGGDHDKHARKRRKREAKQRRDAERPPGSFERFRILSELVDEGRQVIELTDHRARYALVVMSVLNAFVFLVISRSHLLVELPPTSRTWLISFIGVYGGLTFLFVYHAVDCLRPRRLRYTEQLRKAMKGVRDRSASCIGKVSQATSSTRSGWPGARPAWSSSTRRS